MTNGRQVHHLTGLGFPRQNLRDNPHIAAYWFHYRCLRGELFLVALASGKCHIDHIWTFSAMLPCPPGRVLRRDGNPGEPGLDKKWTWASSSPVHNKAEIYSLLPHLQTRACGEITIVWAGRLVAICIFKLTTLSHFDVYGNYIQYLHGIVSLFFPDFPPEKYGRLIYDLFYHLFPKFYIGFLPCHSCFFEMSGILLSSGLKSRMHEKPRPSSAFLNLTGSSHLSIFNNRWTLGYLVPVVMAAHLHLSQGWMAGCSLLNRPLPWGIVKGLIYRWWCRMLFWFIIILRVYSILWLSSTICWGVICFHHPCLNRTPGWIQPLQDHAPRGGLVLVSQKLAPSAAFRSKSLVELCVSGWRNQDLRTR